MKMQSVRPLYPSALALILAMAFSGIAIADENDTQPQASKPYPLAADGLILDIERVGAGFVAVGERGHVLRSNDGAAWQQVIVPVDSLLTAVHFVDEQHGWVVGHDGVILRSENGGQDWQLQRFEPNGAGPLLDVKFISVEEGFAVGAFGTFLQTRDGGDSWTTVDAPAVTDAAVHLYSIDQFDTGRWSLVGEMGFIASSDDGQRWQQLDSPYDGSFYSAAQYGERGALIVGMRGNAFLTRDLGSGNWEQLETGTVLGLTSVAPLNAEQFLVTTLNRKLLLMHASGEVQPLALAHEFDGENTGSFNDVLTVGDHLLVATDVGVVRASSGATITARLAGGG